MNHALKESLFFYCQQPVRYDYGAVRLFLWHCQTLSSPPISSRREKEKKAFLTSPIQAEQSGEPIIQKRPALSSGIRLGFDAKQSAKRNSFEDAAKGQVDGLSDKSLMRWKSTTQKQYTCGGGVVSARPFSESLKRTARHPNKRNTV